MNIDLDKAREIFIEAVGRVPPERWEAFLSASCGPDAELHRHVKHLLQAHAEAGSFLGRPAAEAAGTGAFGAGAGEGPAGEDRAESRERPGTAIGPYKLMEQIGEGGMGLVFVAEQQHPIRRKVALKVIKPGMDTRAVVARFEAERQALALMDHPNIAKVHDGGETASGRPYFVMELIKGVPITDYCDQNQLTPRERLGLFVSVCQAVQHAHQKGIIHRDLKPSNVLVTSHDGTPVVKVIDFGVAKAVGQQLTDKTVYTQFSQLVGTPLYMSPEQAGQSGLDMDTRTDIYALGVLLYELLTGTTPFDKERLSKASYEEIRRIIREEEPPRPSTRFSTLGQAVTTASTRRKSDPKRLGQLIRGDLDWVVMKCLEKDRNRRYETANGLAKDVERYLHDEPVEACPPSAAYKLRKFARKYRAPLRVAAGFVALAVAGGVVSAVLIWRERAEALRQRDEARSQRREAEAHFRKARQAVDHSFTLMSESTLLNHPTLEPLRKQLLQSAVRYYEEFVREHADDPELQAELAAAYFRITNMIYALGTGEDTLTPFEKGVTVMEDLMRKKPDLAALESLQAGIFRPMATYSPTPKPAETLQALQRARAIWEDLVRAHPTVPGFKSDLACLHLVTGLVHMRQHRHAEAVPSFRQGRDLALQATASNPGMPHYRVLLVMALCLLHQELARLGAPREAAEADRQAVEVIHKLAADHPGVPYYQELLAWTWSELSSGRNHLGQLKKEEEAYRQQWAAAEQLAQTFPTVSRYRYQVIRAQQYLADLLWGTGRRAEAAGIFRQMRGWIDRVNLEDADGLDLRAWLLANCPDPSLRDARRAVELARRATTLVPQELGYWTTLGLAHYRAGSWQEAVEALSKPQHLFESSCWNFFLLALAHGQLGRKDQARRCYAQAVQLMEKGHPGDWELRRFREEAEQLLGIKRPAK
jgi:serine/threonine protein kinase